MCGIAAILTPNREKKEHFTKRCLELLHHRGPDAQGRWIDEYVGLAHTRLSILDLSETGSQPMHSESGRYVIVYNGEVYNHLELRKKHFPRKKWHGHSDTETILALFEKLNTDVFPEMVGMWALAIWDKIAKKLLISRDRYGQKPLYYRFYDNGSFALASEIKPLLISGQSNRANPLMVAEYLALGNYDHLGAQTFFAEVEQLLPASFAWVTPNQRGLPIQKYWELPAVPRQDKIPVGTKEVEQLKETLIDAVRSQTLSDVPIGATLSGGLDSSLAVGILASGTTESNPLSVFTAQTPGSRWDESHYVKAVTDKWGARLCLRTKDLNRVRISESLEKNLLIQEEPFGDPSIIAHGFLMDMTKEAGIKVILGGQGADEVFRGYPHNIHQLFSHELSQFNFSYALPELHKAGFHKQETLRILLGAFFPHLERKLRLKSREKRRFFLSKELQEAAREAENQNTLALANNWEDSLRESVQGIHIPHLVHYDDRNGMARSIEGRMPFLDHRLLELVSNFAPEFFFHQGFSKKLIRKAGKDFLPKAVLRRKDKLGFFTPIHEMLRHEINWVEEIVLTNFWTDFEVIKSDITFYKTNGASNERSQRLWRVLSLLTWVKLFRIKI